MKTISHITFLLKKDLLLEWRQKYALGGILLYVVSTVYIIYMILNQQGMSDRLTFKTWSILFWVTVLFTAVNAIAKSFSQESKERLLYYYSIVSPQAIILSKMFYNLLLMLLLTVLCFGAFTVMVGTPVKNFVIFLLAMFLGGAGFSFVLTMISAIAAKAHNSSTLMAILSFPILIPLLLLLQKFAGSAFFVDVDTAMVVQDIVVLLAFDAMLVALSYILFPYLWRD